MSWKKFIENAEAYLSTADKVAKNGIPVTTDVTIPDETKKFMMYLGVGIVVIVFIIVKMIKGSNR